MKSSLNYQLIANGNAYPLFYDTLFFELRQEMTDIAQIARDSNKGIWQDDATTEGIVWAGASSLKTIPPIFPKLWRRLEGYTQDRDFRDDSATLDRFIDYLKIKRSDRLLILPLDRFTGFDNVLEVSGNNIKFLYQPEELVFMS
jgi:hypothetical protein